MNINSKGVKFNMKKFKKLIISIICISMISSFISQITFAEGQTYTTTYSTTDYIHTIVENGLSTVVYCLNDN